MWLDGCKWVEHEEELSGMDPVGDSEAKIWEQVAKCGGRTYFRHHHLHLQADEVELE